MVWNLKGLILVTAKWEHFEVLTHELIFLPFKWFY